MREWADAVALHGDLKRAYEILEQHQGFWAECLRGRTRLLQLRLEESRKHLEHAAELEDETATPVQVLLHRCYLREQALLDGSHRANISFPDYPPRTKEIATALRFHKVLEAFEWIHEGFSTEGLEILEHLIENHADDSRENLGIWHLGAATACANLGVARTRDVHLEIAELHAACLETSFSRARLAARLYGMHTMLGRGAPASSWRRFLEAQECPLETKEALLRRADLLVGQAQKQGHLVFA